MAAGDISNVDIADDVRVPPEGVDQIALHQLHMIDVIQQLYIGRPYDPNDIRSRV